MPGIKEIAPGGTRADIGRTYEDFIVGHIYEHRPGRTITEADNVWFTLLTMNQHPLHFDTAYAAETEFKKPLVNSCLTLSIVTGMSVADVSQKAIANLGWGKVELTAPVFVGDTIYAESEVLSKRPSKSVWVRASSPCARAASRPRHRFHERSSVPCLCRCPTRLDQGRVQLTMLIRLLSLSVHTSSDLPSSRQGETARRTIGASKNAWSCV